MWYWFVLDLLPQVLEQRANQDLRQGLQPIFVCRFWGFRDQLCYKERHLWKISAVLWDEAFWRLKTSEHLGRKSLMAWSFWLSSLDFLHFLIMRSLLLFLLDGCLHRMEVVLISLSLLDHGLHSSLCFLFPEWDILLSLLAKSIIDVGMKILRTGPSWLKSRENMIGIPPKGWLRQWSSTDP